MDAREAGRLIVKKLTTKPPYGVKVTATIKGTTPWWTTDPEGPAFEAARGALKAGFVKAMRSTIHLYDALARLPRR